MHWTADLEINNAELVSAAEILLQWINHDKASLDRYKMRKDANPEAVKIQEQRLQALFLSYQKIKEGSSGLLKCCTSQYNEGKKMGLWLASQEKNGKKAFYNKEAFRHDHNQKVLTTWADHF